MTKKRRKKRARPETPQRLALSTYRGFQEYKNEKKVKNRRFLRNKVEEGHQSGAVNNRELEVYRE